MPTTTVYFAVKAWDEKPYNEHQGTFDTTGVTARVVILPEPGTGDLRGLRGDGSLALGGHAERYPLSLNYTFAD